MKRCILIFSLAMMLTDAVAQISARRVVITGQITNGNDTTPKVPGINFLNPFDNSRKSAKADTLMKFSAEEKYAFCQKHHSGLQ